MGSPCSTGYPARTPSPLLNSLLLLSFPVTVVFTVHIPCYYWNCPSITVKFQNLHLWQLISYLPLYLIPNMSVLWPHKSVSCPLFCHSKVPFSSFPAATGLWLCHSDNDLIISLFSLLLKLLGSHTQMGATKFSLPEILPVMWPSPVPVLSLLPQSPKLLNFSPCLSHPSFSFTIRFYLFLTEQTKAGSQPLSHAALTTAFYLSPSCLPEKAYLPPYSPGGCTSPSAGGNVTNTRVWGGGGDVCFVLFFDTGFSV